MSKAFDFVGKNPEVAAVVLVVGGLGLWLFFRGFKGVAADTVKAIGNTGAGVVIGAGQVVGIPETSNTQCEIDIANGDYWKASASCPAPRFIQYTITGK